LNVKRVLIDGYNLGLEKGTGVATYARNLSYELNALGHEVAVLYGNRSAPSRETLLREITFFDSNVGDRNRLLDLIDDVQRALLGPLRQIAVPVPLTGKVISRQFAARLPYFDHIYNATDVFSRSHSAFKLWQGITSVGLAERPDLAHWTYPVPLKIKKTPNIYTLHDLVPLRLPYTTLDNKKRYLRLLQKLDQSADHFVTVSECSKRDLIEILGIPAERITNTYQSVDIPAKFRDKPEDQVMREVEGATGVGYKDYFLFWGSIEPKKNIGRMIEAYLASKVEAPLVIVGAQAWKAEEELRLLNDENITFLRNVDHDIVTRKRVIQLSYAPFSLLVSLIRGAKAALFPSLYEGFGLPALEAMLLGTPVICSNTSSLPEVVGEAAEMVDPYDTAAISAAIRKLDADAGWRAELRVRGLAQAKLYTPDRYRTRLAELYSRFL
jgi:glycosyltransferase involved in cell wall biosynthesis